MSNLLVVVVPKLLPSCASGGSKVIRGISAHKGGAWNKASSSQVSLVPMKP